MKSGFKTLGKLIVTFLPWSLRRKCLQRFWKYEIHSSARIGIAWIFPKKLVMGANTRIAHFNVAIHLENLVMKANSSIGRGNWITGYPLGGSRHFTHQKDRDPSLIIGESSAITKNHHLDCTHRIEVGSFTTIAGYQSQFLTHSIDLQECRQDSYPIKIGDYCLIGTNVVVLGGAVLPDRSVLGAKALLNKMMHDTDNLYAGVPARCIGPIKGKRKYFYRERGFVE